jgi:hypothetical protein
MLGICKSAQKASVWGLVYHAPDDPKKSQLCSRYLTPPAGPHQVHRRLLPASALCGKSIA